jgi:hypothetical protein
VYDAEHYMNHADGDKPLTNYVPCATCRERHSVGVGGDRVDGEDTRGSGRPWQTIDGQMVVTYNAYSVYYILLCRDTLQPVVAQLVIVEQLNHPRGVGF